MIRLLMAGGLAFILAAVGTKVLINLLMKQKIGQPIREDGPQGHMTKAGTPTMGGLAIVAGAGGGYVLSDVLFGGVFTRSGLLAMGAICAAGLVGLADDWLKVSRERNLGLNSRMKMAGLLLVAGGFAVLTMTFTSTHTEISFTRWSSPGIDLGTIGWVMWAILVILSMSNAVISLMGSTAWRLGLESSRLPPTAPSGSGSSDRPMKPTRRSTMSPMP